MINVEENEILRDLLGVNGLNPFDGADSASRKQMFASHLGQTLVIKGSTPRLCQTGMEREFGKYTFSVKVPGKVEDQDGIRVLSIIERYRPTMGSDSINFNPQTIIIYEDVKTKEVGYIDLPQYRSYHQYFGFEYKKQSALKDLRVGSFIPGGTVLLDSPSKTDDGDYMYGGEFKVAFMSVPAVAEDGVMISSDVLDRLSFKTYQERTVDFGSKRYAMNMYGNDKVYKPFPDIGEQVRPDGILMCLRSYNKELGAVEQSVLDLQQPDHTHDKIIYAPGGGRVVDILIHHNNQNSQSGMPPGMEEQLEKYDNARRTFYSSILQVEQSLRKECRDRNTELKLTRKMHRLCVVARNVIEADQQRIQNLHRQTPLDDWRITFVIECVNVPNIGNKITDCHGGKGVMCYVARPEEMPVDQFGNRADVVVDPNSTVSRMNLGRLYEHYFNAVGTNIMKQLREMLGYSAGAFESLPLRELEKHLNNLEKNQTAVMDAAWNHLMGFYRIISPARMYKWFTSNMYKGTRAYHLSQVLRHDIVKYLPPENEPELLDMVRQLEKEYPPPVGPVTYIGYSGRKVTTKNPVRIASMYLILLEKTGDDWTAVDSGKLQHFGVLSQVTNSDKYSTPTRNQPIRALGESEVRIYASYAGVPVTAEIMDRNNNPATHKKVVQSILEAPIPTNIPVAVNRQEIPLGMARPLQLVNHIAQCAGWKFVYTPHVPTSALPPQQQ